MSCRLIFVRHGQSMGNFYDAFLGHTDLDLSPRGYEQAQCTAEFLKDVHIDKIYSSDLIRAHNTAVPLSELKNVQIIDDVDLREIDAGQWENQKFSFLEANFKYSYGLWLTDIGKSFADDGETVPHLYKRIVDWTEKIAKENDGKTLAVFTHATPIRALFCHAYGYTIDSMKDVPWASNASVSQVLYKDGSFEVLSYSTDEFMGELGTKLPDNV